MVSPNGKVALLDGALVQVTPSTLPDYWHVSVARDGNLDYLTKPVHERGLLDALRVMVGGEVDDSVWTTVDAEPTKDNPWAERPTSPLDPDLPDVYLIQSAYGGLVKIGVANSAAARLEEIQRMSPVPLRVLHVFPAGGYALETRLHRAFADRRSHGEWFDFGDVDPVATVAAEVAR